MKTIWCDVETSGLDPNRNSIVQIALIIEARGLTLEWSSYMRPWPGAEIEDQALAVNGLSREQVQSFPSHLSVFSEFVAVMEKFVDKFDRRDKFWFRAYNASFDMSFVHAWARACGEKYLMSFIRWPEQCVAQAISIKHPDRWARLQSRKLGAVCQEFGVALGENAHDALADVRATKALWEAAYND